MGLLEEGVAVEGLLEEGVGLLEEGVAVEGVVGEDDPGEVLELEDVLPGDDPVGVGVTVVPLPLPQVTVEFSGILLQF